jgi:hypothetical protein
MHLEVLVEEPSAEVALRALLPRILDPGHTFQLHPHGGKAALLRHLVGRLRGYRAWVPPDFGIVVLVDRDADECHDLKSKLLAAARGAGFRPRTDAGDRPFDLLARIVVEELEAWYLGDAAALRQAYPRLPRTLTSDRLCRDPDALRGGTWEALERLFQRHGYFHGGLRKLEAAATIAPQMDPDRNTSGSFGVFRDGLRDMVRRHATLRVRP